MYIGCFIVILIIMIMGIDSIEKKLLLNLDELKKTNRQLSELIEFIGVPKPKPSIKVYWGNDYIIDDWKER